MTGPQGKGSAGSGPRVRPSAVSRDRLASRLHADVADVRVRLEEATLRSDAYLAAGHPDRAAEVLDEQQALLAELHDTLAASLSAAAVEAEAEAILGELPEAAELFGAPPREPARATDPAPPLDAPAATPPDRASSGPWPASLPGRSEPRGGPRRFRASAAALVSAVAAMALLLMVSSPQERPSLAAADVDGAERADRAVGDETPDPSAATSGGSGAADGPALAPAVYDVRQLFASAAASVDAGVTDDLRFHSGLSELQSLVDQLVATVVRVAGDLTDSGLRAATDRVRSTSPASDRTATSTHPPSPLPPEVVGGDADASEEIRSEVGDVRSTDEHVRQRPEDDDAAADGSDPDEPADDGSEEPAADDRGDDDTSTGTSSDWSLDDGLGGSDGLSGR